MLSTNLVADLLARQDPAAPHTLLTRLLISAIIVFANAVYFGFFGILGIVAFYLVGIELLNFDNRSLLLPLAFALLVGLWQSIKMLTDYWRHYGHG